MLCTQAFFRVRIVSFLLHMYCISVHALDNYMSRSPI